jgi:hypothetical protein
MYCTPTFDAIQVVPHKIDTSPTATSALVLDEGVDGEVDNGGAINV